MQCSKNPLIDFGRFPTPTRMPYWRVLRRAIGRCSRQNERGSQDSPALFRLWRLCQLFYHQAPYSLFLQSVRLTTTNDTG